MADTIKINITYVRGLKSQVEDTSGRLRGDVGDVQQAVHSDPDVNDKLHDFMGKWDKRRGQVADTLDAVASALHSIDDSFTQTDDKLASQVNGGG